MNQSASDVEVPQPNRPVSEHSGVAVEPGAVALPDETRQAAEPSFTACWRCGKQVESTTEKCPYCYARLVSEAEIEEPTRLSPRSAAEDSTQFLRVIAIYAAFLATSLVSGWIYHFGLDRTELGRTELGQQLNSMLVAEGVDSCLILFALWWIGRPAAAPAAGRTRRLAAWLGAMPVLALLLVANHGYHEWLRAYARLPLLEDKLAAAYGMSPKLLLAYCAQPAIFEELFFRYLVLDTLRRPAGTHAAVFVSSLMFGLAHIGAPLSIPVLTLIGMGLGYARVASRSIALPIFMHFAHNLAIVWMAA
jgi:membrane protease YdiL (CAAX protease family)